MKKNVTIILALLMLTAVFAGCGRVQEPTGGKPYQEPEKPVVQPAKPAEQSEEPAEQPEESVEVNSDVAVNIEGVVEEIDGSRIKLDSGKWIVITDAIVFGDDPDCGTEEVNREFEVGNLIAGYTEDDIEKEEVTAYAIYTNTSMQINAKVVVNIEGKIVEIDGNRIKLDSGKWIVITEKTIFEDDPDCGVEKVDDEFVVGNFIAGYTEDDPNAGEVTAYQIYSNTTF